MSKKAALGRGFDSLIPVDFEINDVAVPGEQIKNLKLDKIVNNPEQPRKEFDEDSLKELASSIKRHGVLQPIVVIPVSGKDDKYRIVAGERRYRASKIANLSTIPAIIRNHKELEELEISLVENVQRVDLSPLEQAVSISKLRDQFSLSYKEIAAKLGKAETTISNIVRLLKLPKQAVQALQKNQISEGHARAILALSNDEKLQLELLNKIITQNISVREAEQFVHNNKKPKSNTGSNNSVAVQNILDKLNKEIVRNVKVVEKKKGGVVKIAYSDNKQLKKILNSF